MVSLRAGLCALVVSGCAAPEPGTRTPRERIDLATEAPAALELAHTRSQVVPSRQFEVPERVEPLVTLPAPDPPACASGVSGQMVDVRDCAGLGSAIDVLMVPGVFGLTLVTGQAFADIDGDSWLDLITTSSNGDSRLYLGSSDGSFTESVGALNGPIYANGVLAADFDDDGDRDVYLYGVDDVLLDNQSGTLVPVDSPSTPALSMGASVADLDGDGLLELFVANHACTGCDPMPACDGTVDNLWSQGPTGWEDHALDALSAGPVPPCGLGFIGVFSDLDDDGLLDLYVANDRGRNQPDGPGLVMRNTFWRNLGSGCAGGACFEEQARDVGLAGFVNSMGIDIADIDDDGDLDVAVSHSGPTLAFLNDGFGGFSDATTPLRIHAPAVADGWGVLWLDVDNDGDLDLFTAVTGVDVLLRNDGGTFTDISDTALSGPGELTRGASLADYDRDGRLDLLTGAHGGHYRLYRNTIAPLDHHWLGLRLVGSGPGGSDAIGAVVTVEDSSGRIQRRDVKAGFSNGGGSDLAVHVGLGLETLVEVRITWPDGTEELVAPPVDAWSVLRQQ